MTNGLATLTSALATEALIPLGHCPVEPADNIGTGTIVLVGPDEPRFWATFTASPEYQDGAANPLDRWSRRVVSDIAQAQDAAPLFPFGGPPYLPFYTWALRTGRFWASPIGFLVHDQAGLFASFRGAILLTEEIAASPSAKPCNNCSDQPCALACPVEAFADGYDVTACKTHLASASGTDCMTQGCRARRACPIGQGNRLPAQAAFHMDAFL